jgi:heme A synthase
LSNIKLDRFAKFAWSVLAYNILVILWGALVRATGSGAGCGEHWPLCNGAVIPDVAVTSTAIEFTHRIMSGIVLILTVIYFVWSRKVLPPGHRVRFGVNLIILFTVLESLVGAGLVIFGLTAYNTSQIRALVVAVHLVNTMLLAAALTMTAWWASGGSAPRWKEARPAKWMIAGSLLGMLALGATGAITALGDTLFPASSLIEGINQDLDPAAHFLVQLRVIHPVVAMLLTLLIVLTTGAVRMRSHNPILRWLAAATLALYLAQVGVGVINVLLLAPVWIQILHLLVTNLLWVALVVMAIEYTKGSQPA